MHLTFKLDREGNALYDARGLQFDLATRTWGAPVTGAPAPPAGETVDLAAAVRWLQRESKRPLRVPIGVIGPREATVGQLAAAERIGAGLADLGLFVICGGLQGVMQAVAEGVKRAGGIAIGVLPEGTPDAANDYVRIIIATGLGEARNAVIARAALCLVAIGDSPGTLTEVVFGRQFGKVVIGVEGAARVEGVRHVTSCDAAITAVSACVLAVTTGPDDVGHALP
jgi:uncharacterized protein (TIGR00725 family)